MSFSIPVSVLFFIWLFSMCSRGLRLTVRFTQPIFLSSQLCQWSPQKLIINKYALVCFLTFAKFVSENVNFLTWNEVMVSSMFFLLTSVALNMFSDFSSIFLCKSVNANLGSDFSLPSLKHPESLFYVPLSQQEKLLSPRRAVISFIHSNIVCLAQS